MSSLVQPKWTSSVRCSPAPTIPSRRRLTKYSTALTSWTVSRSISASSATSSVPKSSTTWRSRDCSSTVRLRTPGTTPEPVRWISHSTSTRTRSRLSAASERWSTSGATAAR